MTASLPSVPLVYGGLRASLGLLLLPALALFVVFGMGAIDPRLAIRRTLFYGILALGGVFGFGVVETAVTDYLISAAGLPAGMGALITGGIMAVTFKPVHRFLEKIMSRVFGAAHA